MYFGILNSYIFKNKLEFKLVIKLFPNRNCTEGADPIPRSAFLTLLFTSLQRDMRCPLCSPCQQSLPLKAEQCRNSQQGQTRDEPCHRHTAPKPRSGLSCSLPCKGVTPGTGQVIGLDSTPPHTCHQKEASTIKAKEESNTRAIAFKYTGTTGWSSSGENIDSKKHCTAWT